VMIANIYGTTIEDCVEVIRVLNDAPGIALYELNASCPNTSMGGMVFGTDPDSLYQLALRCRQVSQRPLMVKLSPNVTNIGLMAKICEDAGAQAISLVNTFLALSIDIETRRPRIANVTGGLSGPSIPVVGMGGIVRAEDAVEFMLAGATAVEVGTATFADPRAVENIANDLRRWCASHDVATVSDLTGAMVR